MPKTYCTIAVEVTDFTEVIKALESYFSIQFHRGDSELALGFSLNVYHAPIEWLHGIDSCGDPLPEEEDFYKEFEVSSFLCFVDIFCESSNFAYRYINAVADSIGLMISEKTCKRSLVFFDGTNIPFCLYDKGKRVRLFREYFQDYFNDKDWIYNFII